MRWEQRQRLAFIGERLLSAGAVNRRDLISKFGVSVPQASIDLRRFDESHPGAMRYDKSRKAYVPDKLTTPEATGASVCPICGESFPHYHPESSFVTAQIRSAVRDIRTAIDGPMPSSKERLDHWIERYVERAVGACLLHHKM